MERVDSSIMMCRSCLAVVIALPLTVPYTGMGQRTVRGFLSAEKRVMWKMMRALLEIFIFLMVSRPPQNTVQPMSATPSVLRQGDFSNTPHLGEAVPSSAKLFQATHRLIGTCMVASGSIFSTVCHTLGRLWRQKTVSAPPAVVDIRQVVSRPSSIVLDGVFELVGDCFGLKGAECHTDN